jgi:raffinose/stachyose/melibiose transport system substrate-binding protein
MNKFKSMILVFAFILTATGCSSPATTGKTDQSASPPASNDTGTKGSDQKKDPVIIKFPSIRTGNNVGAKFYLPQIERFNKKYEGKYQIQLETIVQNEYINKIKLLYQQKKLPPLVDIGADKDFAKIVIDNGDLLDLKPYLDKIPELNSILLEDSVKYNTDKNGKIIALPFSYERPIGLYYNKDIFKAAGINDFPATWDDFFSSLDKIKATGKAPLALMTGENAWTTILLASAMLASEPEGEKLLKAGEIVTDYNSSVWVSTFTKIQKLLQNYTTKSAMGAQYAVAANEFLSGNTAMIANGPWMVSDFSNIDKTSKGFAEKVGATIYPNGVALGSADGYGNAIPKDTPQNVIDGLIEYFKFLYSPDELNAFLVAEGGFAPKLKMSDADKQKLDPILAQLNDELEKKMKLLSRTIYDIAPQPVADLFSKNLPLLATKDMTPEQFCKALTDAAQKFKK